MNAEQLIQLLDELMRRLDGPAKYVFELSVRQVVVGGILDIGLAIALAIAIPTVGRRIMRAERKYEGGSPIFSVVVIGIACVLVVLLTIDGVSHLLNPEWYAIKDILGLITGK